GRIELTHIPRGRISAHILLTDIEGFPWNPYAWLLLTGVFVLLMQGALYARLRNEARRRRVADRAAKRSGEFEHLLSETASRLAESSPESTTKEIKRGLSQIRSHFAVDTFSLFYNAEGGNGLHSLTSSIDGVIDSVDPLIKVGDSPWLMGRLGAGKAVLIENVHDL